MVCVFIFAKSWIDISQSVWHHIHWSALLLADIMTLRNGRTQAFLHSHAAVCIEKTEITTIK